MRRTDDPECPRCGCTDSTALESRLRFGKQVARLECTHCLHRFTPPEPVEPVEPGADDDQDEADAEEAAPGRRTTQQVAYTAQPARCACPQCRARNPPVKSTRAGADGRTIRHHRCTTCGHRFKSIEDVG
jgi:transcriptional regulator NrdR family protein